MAQPIAYDNHNVNYLPTDGYSGNMSERQTLISNDTIKFDPSSTEKFAIFLRSVTGLFISMCNLDRLIKGVELEPVQIVGETPAHYNARLLTYRQRVRIGVDILQGALNRHMVTSQDIQYVTACEGLPTPKEILDKLTSVVIPKGSVESASNAVDWIQSSNRDDSRKPDVYYAQHQALFGKNALITTDTLNAVIYLNGLPQRFNPVIQEFLGKPNFTIEEFHQKVQAAELISKSAAKSNATGFSTAFVATTTADVSAL